MMTKFRTAHFIFAEGTKYSDLKDIYPKILETFLNETGQMPEDRNLFEIWLERDMKEIEKNRKPEGFLKQNAIKMVFPIRDDDIVEFYLHSTSKTQNIPIIAEKIDAVLKKSKLKYEIKYDKLLRYAKSK
jgi:hypothetical protein